MIRRGWWGLRRRGEAGRIGRVLGGCDGWEWLGVR